MLLERSALGSVWQQFSERTQRKTDPHMEAVMEGEEGHPSMSAGAWRRPWEAARGHWTGARSSVGASCGVQLQSARACTGLSSRG